MLDDFARGRGRAASPTPAADPGRLRPSPAAGRHRRRSPRPGTGSDQSAQAVRFADAVGRSPATASPVFLEIGPDAVLAAHGQPRPSSRPAHASSPALRGDARRAGSVLRRPAAHAARRGGAVDWARRSPHRDPHGRPADLRLPARAVLAEAAAPGDGRRRRPRPATDHPLLGAAVTLADGGGVSSPAGCRCAPTRGSADHAVVGTRPPARHRLRRAGPARRRPGRLRPRLEELTLETPLVVPGRGRGATCRSRVGAPDDDGRRRSRVHSRTDDDRPDAPGPARQRRSSPRPPRRRRPRRPARAGRRPARTRDRRWRPVRPARRAGLRLRPDFRGLRAAWRLGDELYAEVRLPRADARRPTTSASTRRCSTRPCTSSSPRPSTRRRRSCCRSPGPACTCTGTGADRLRVGCPRTARRRTLDLADQHGRTRRTSAPWPAPSRPSSSPPTRTTHPVPGRPRPGPRRGATGHADLATCGADAGRRSPVPRPAGGRRGRRARTVVLANPRPDAGTACTDGTTWSGDWTPFALARADATGRRLADSGG